MRSFGAFVERAQQLTDPGVQLADALLQEHLGADAARQPIVSESFTAWDDVNVCRAIQVLERGGLTLTSGCSTNAPRRSVRFSTAISRAASMP